MGAIFQNLLMLPLVWHICRRLSSPKRMIFPKRTLISSDDGVHPFVWRRQTKNYIWEDRCSREKKSSRSDEDEFKFNAVDSVLDAVRSMQKHDEPWKTTNYRLKSGLRGFCRFCRHRQIRWPRKFPWQAGNQRNAPVTEFHSTSAPTLKAYSTKRACLQSR